MKSVWKWVAAGVGTVASLIAGLLALRFIRQGANDQARRAASEDTDTTIREGDELVAATTAEAVSEYSELEERVTSDVASDDGDLGDYLDRHTGHGGEE